MRRYFKNKSGIITAIEISVLFLLISSFFIYFNHNLEIDNKYNLNLESSLDSLLFLDQHRKILILENLSSSFLIEDWSNIEIYLDKVFLNYELIISNSTISKKIFSCESQISKTYTSRVVGIYNNSNYEFRKIILGVCI